MHRCLIFFSLVSRLITCDSTFAQEANTSPSPVQTVSIGVRSFPDLHQLLNRNYIINSDRTRHAYVWGSISRKEQLWADGLGHPEFDEIWKITYHHQAVSWTYLAKRSGRWYFVSEMQPAFDPAETPETDVTIRRLLSTRDDAIDAEDDRVLNALQGVKLKQQELGRGLGDPFQNIEILPKGYDVSKDGSSFAVAAKAIKSNKIFVLKNNIPGKLYDDLSYLTLNQDGSLLAYIATEGKKQFLVINNQEGPAFDKCRRLKLSDRETLSYEASLGESSFIVVGGNAGPKYENVSEIKFSTNQQNFAYWGVRGDTNYLVLNGKEIFETTEVVKIGEMVFAEDANVLAFIEQKRNVNLSEVTNEQFNARCRVAVVRFSDNTELEFHKTSGSQIQELVLSPNGQMIAFGIGRIADNRKEIDFFNVVGDALFGPFSREYIPSTAIFNKTGNHYAFKARTPGLGKTLVYLDGEQVGIWDFVSHMDFSPDGKRFAFIAESNGERELQVDGKAQKLPFRIVGKVAWDPNGKCVAVNGYLSDRSHSFIVVGDQVLGPFDRLENFQFTDMNRLTCTVFRGPGQIGALQGKRLYREVYDLSSNACLMHNEADSAAANPCANEANTAEMVDVPARQIESKKQSAESPLTKAERLAVENLEKQRQFLETNGKALGVVTMPNGIQYKVIKAGNGRSPTAESRVKCHYVGKLLDKTTFDNTRDRGEPAEFPVSGIVPGLSLVLPQMKAGDMWQVFIPSSLAYGKQGIATIGPNELLAFEIELLEVLD